VPIRAAAGKALIGGVDGADDRWSIFWTSLVGNGDEFPAALVRGEAVVGACVTWSSCWVTGWFSGCSCC
jgi:hypothetical protein